MTALRQRRIEVAYGETDVDPEYYGTDNSDDDDDDDDEEDDDTKLDSIIHAKDSLVAV